MPRPNFIKVYSVRQIYICIAVVFLSAVYNNDLSAQTNSTPIAINKKTGHIKGGVTDKIGMAIPGVSVVNTTAKVTALTNIDGDFEIAASAGDELEISFAGMLSQNIKITGLNNLEIELSDSKQSGNTTLASYPMPPNPAPSGNVPVKFSLPDQNFFNSLAYYVRNKVK